MPFSALLVVLTSDDNPYYVGLVLWPMWLWDEYSCRLASRDCCHPELRREPHAILCSHTQLAEKTSEASSQ